jgi:hypothetical protein
VKRYAAWVRSSIFYNRKPQPHRPRSSADRAAVYGTAGESSILSGVAVRASTSLYEPTRSAVFRAWQFAQRTSHLLTSAAISAQGRPFTTSVATSSVLSPKWSKSSMAGLASPQSTHACCSRYSSTRAALRCRIRSPYPFTRFAPGTRRRYQARATSRWQDRQIQWRVPRFFKR